MWFEFLILCAVLAYLVYRRATAHDDYFEKRGIPHKKKKSFFSGVMIEMIMRRKSQFDVQIDQYRDHEAPVSGIFDMGKPVYLVRDPELITKITIKDFDHFVNHSKIFGGDTDGDIFGNGLFSLRDGKWKDMRSTLSPAFTGSKLRHMFDFMNPVAKNFIAHLKKEELKYPKDAYELEMKQHVRRFASDVVASTAFGLEVNSMEEKDNEFYRMGRKLMDIGVVKALKFVLFMNCKTLMKWLGIDVFEKDLTQYFRRLVLGAMKNRQQHNIRRPDMINLLMEARGMLPSDTVKTHDRIWTDTEIAAQCLIFFLAGFETTSTLMLLAMHELMENPEAQQKLYEEAKAVREQLKGEELSYDILHAMKYMAMVVSETLRKWPPNLFIDRECSKDITYNVNGIQLALKQGDMIWIPAAGIQRDPKYYEQPDKFKPQRFSEQNKQNMLSSTYLPFGSGPRLCIGSRFALMEAKTLLYNVVLNYKVEAAEKTTTPIELSRTSMQIMPKTGYWFKLIARDQ